MRLTIWRMLAALGLLVTLAGSAALAAAAPGTGGAPRSNTSYQDDDDGDDDGTTAGAARGTIAGSRPVDIHAGTCVALGNARFPLTGVALPVLGGAGGAGAAGDDDDDDDAGFVYRGAQGAAEGEVSESEVNASIDDLLGAPHAISIAASQQDANTAVACGELGGSVVGGRLIVGLRPANGSGLAGIAVIGDDDDDGQSDVAVYLAPVGPTAAAPIPTGGVAVPAPIPAPAPAAPVYTGDDDGDDGGGDD